MPLTTHWPVSQPQVVPCYELIEVGSNISILIALRAKLHEELFTRRDSDLTWDQGEQLFTIGTEASIINMHEKNVFIMPITKPQPATLKRTASGL
jgi:hypothetical protein